MDDFRDFLNELLATTLIVDDGTRLKPIYLEWSSLSEDERAVARRAVINAVKEELKAHPSERLRLEFSELPEDLDEDLKSLLGEENPDVEWTVVTPPFESA